MATYFTDFSEYASNASPSDWTKQGYQGFTAWNVREKAGTISGKCLEFTNTWISTAALTWNDIDADANRANIEVLIRFRSTAHSDDQVRLLLRASGIGSSLTGYALAFPTLGKLQLFSHVSGAPAEIGNIAWTMADNTWYWVRFRANGTSIQARVWNDGSAEPSTWDISVTNSAVSAAGQTGIWAYGTAGTRDVDYYSVGTNGDTAPGIALADTEPPVPGSVTVAATGADELTINVGAGSDNVAVTSRTLQVFSDSARTTQVGTDVEASVGDNTVSGLSEATQYWVRVIYADAAANTAWGEATGTTLDVTDPTPGTVTVTGLNDTQLNVAVGAGSDNVAVTSRTLQVFSDAGRTVQVGTDIAADAGDNTVSGLTAETTYYVTVIYADAAGNTASVDASGATMGDCWVRVAQMPLEVDYTIPSAALLAQAAVEVDLTGTTSVQIAHAIVEIDYVLATDDGGGDGGGGTPNDGTTVPFAQDEEIILGYDPQKHRIGLAVSYAVDEVVKHDLYTFDNEAGGWGRIEPATDAYDFDTVTCRATAERDADAHLLFGNAAGQSLRVFDPDNAPVSWEWRSKEATGADFGGFAKTFQFTGLRVDWHKADPTLAGSVTATVFIDGKPMPALNIAEQTSRTYVLGPRASGHRCSVALEGVNAEVTALRYSLAEARN